MKKILVILRNKNELILMGFLLIIAGAAHGYNLFNFPYFENDEASYIAYAWKFIQESLTGKFTVYTYYYDHAPVGWMFLGIWLKLTGGLTAFGVNPLISGRIFIFVLHIYSVLLLYLITKRITRQKLAATFAVIIFSMSPLELYYGRRVLLDNIMIFWILFSLFFATSTPQRLRSVVLSAITFAIASLTKESALFMGPALIYTVWIYSKDGIKKWAIGTWLAVSSIILLLYPLFALLNGELFPSNTIFGGNKEHVSLIQTTIYQTSRGNFAFPWQTNSDFYISFLEWLNRDPFIIVTGIICLLFSIILNEKYREIKAIALTALFEFLFLARGKFIISFYIIPVLPLLAIIISSVITRPLIWAKDHISINGFAFVISAFLGLIFIVTGTHAFIRNETDNQTRAIYWIKQNIPVDAYFAVDNYAYPQLRFVDGYRNMDFIFKIQYDPAIQKIKYNKDPNKIEYILVTHEVLRQMKAGQLPFIKTAFDHSRLIADFRTNTTSYIDVKNLISTNGDWAQVYKVEDKNAGILVDGWRSYKRNFMKDTGQVIDPMINATTSEGQSYAMLRSIDMNDRLTFDRAWNWTKKNLQKRKTDVLFAWKMDIDNQGENHLNDTNSATDADQDIAFALYKASVLWNDKKYLREAKKIINDIWKKEVISQNNRYYLVSSPERPSGNRLLINPSYIAPGEYKIFAVLDPTHSWLKLVDDSYTLLQEIQDRSKVGLFSNWVAVEKDGKLVSASLYFDVNSPDSYGYDAFRVNWRMVDDISDDRAQKILDKLNSFIKSVWSKNNTIAAMYDLEGSPQTKYSDIPTSAGAAIGLHARYESLALDIYHKEIMSRFHTDGIYWGQPWNYYSQNWALFGLQYLDIGGPNSKGNKL